MAAKGVDVPSVLVSPGFLVDDVATPRFRCEKGTLTVSGKAGLGVELDPRKLERYQVS